MVDLVRISFNTVSQKIMAKACYEIPFLDRMAFVFILCIIGHVHYKQ